MPSNNSSGLVHYLAGKHPLKIGWLLTPSEFKEPRAWLPYAVDNGVFGAWENQRQWQAEPFFELLDRCRLSKFKPDWVAVPDSVGNREETLRMWQQYEDRVRRYGWRLAFVVQDGMTPNDVPTSADVVFVGGTTTWKWRNVALFCATFPRVHVGRVNWVDKLEYCERVGVESCDGTGFFRGGPDSIQAQQLADFVAGIRRSKQQAELFGIEPGFDSGRRGGHSSSVAHPGRGDHHFCRSEARQEKRGTSAGAHSRALTNPKGSGTTLWAARGCRTGRAVPPTSSGKRKRANCESPCMKQEAERLI